MKAPSVRRAMTAKQQKVLDAIKNLTHERGIPPTVREIQERCQFRSPNGVTTHLYYLEANEKIIWNRGCARGILTADADERSKLLARVASLTTEQLRLVADGWNV